LAYVLKREGYLAWNSELLFIQKEKEKKIELKVYITLLKKGKYVFFKEA